MANSAAKIIAEGRVQGVGFRFFVRQHASALGLTGWVRNCADGSVEIQTEGDRETVELFIDRIRQGPTFGHVSNLEISWHEPDNTHSSFDITF